MRAGRQADDVPVLGAGERRGADLVVGALADHVELALEREVVADLGRALDEHLAHERLAGARGLAEHAVVGGHGAPAEHVQAFGLHDLLEALFDLAADGGVARQEDDAAAVLAGGGQLDARLPADFVVEGVRHLQQDARAVARVDLGAAGTAMVQVLEHLDRLLEDPVGLVALDVDDEALAAGVMLEARVVQALLGRRAQLHRRVLGHPVGPGRQGGIFALLYAHRALPASNAGVACAGPTLSGTKTRAAASLTRTTIVDA